jgi:hypothetical protein
MFQLSTTSPSRKHNYYKRQPRGDKPLLNFLLLMNVLFDVFLYNGATAVFNMRLTFTVMHLRFTTSSVLYVQRVDRETPSHLRYGVGSRQKQR